MTLPGGNPSGGDVGWLLGTWVQPAQFLESREVAVEGNPRCRVVHQRAEGGVAVNIHSGLHTPAGKLRQVRECLLTRRGSHAVASFQQGNGLFDSGRRGWGRSTACEDLRLCVGAAPHWARPPQSLLGLPCWLVTRRRRLPGWRRRWPRPCRQPGPSQGSPGCAPAAVRAGALRPRGPRAGRWCTRR